MIWDKGEKISLRIVQVFEHSYSTLRVLHRGIRYVGTLFLVTFPFSWKVDNLKLRQHLVSSHALMVANTETETKKSVE